VLSELQKFVNYVKNGPVINLLPSAVHGLSSCDAADVLKWHEQIARALRHTRPLGAIAGCWLSLLDEMFRGALQRLDELARASDRAGSGPVRAKSTPTPPGAQR
jgi:hypothetical protein